MSRHVLAKTVLLVWGVVLALLVSEIFLRLFLPQDLIKPLKIQLDPEIIYTLSPNSEAYFRGTSVRMYHLKTNSVGLREREIPFEKPDGTFRILLLGDSMSMGEGVASEKTYLRQLESLLEKEATERIETINAAVRGYGSDQELLLFRRLGKTYDPDLVILAFFLYNDMQDNWEAKLFQWEEGKLIQQPAAQGGSTKYHNYVRLAALQRLPGLHPLMSHSHLANWLRITYSNLLRRRADQAEKENKKEDTPLAQQPAFHLTRGILEAWGREVRASGAQPFFLILPDRNKIQMLRREDTVDIARLDLALETFCREQNIPFLNLTHFMLAWGGDFESLWLEDGHFSPEGHTWVSHQLSEALRSLNSGFPESLPY